MKCTNCGFENEENALVCQSCGANLAEPKVEKAEDAPAKKCCGLLKNKAALIGLAAVAAIVLLLVIVISAIANSGNGFIERECEYSVIQNEEGDLVVLNGKKLLKDKIDIETPDEADWELGESIDGSIATLVVEDVDGEEDVETLYIIKKNKIVKVAENVEDYTLSITGETLVYTVVDEEKEEATLVSYTVKNGKTKDIAKSDEESYVDNYILSPDGKTVAYTMNESESEGDGDVKQVTYLYNGKKSEKITTAEISLIAMSNKAKYIYAAVEEEKEDGTEVNLYIYNKKGEKETKLGKIAGNWIQFNADCTQAIYQTKSDKGDTYSYLSINGKEGIKLAKTTLTMAANGINATGYYENGALVLPVDDLYDHVYMSVKYGENSVSYDMYLVKKGEDKTVKLVSGISGDYTLDQSAEYLYYKDADDKDNTLMVLKIAKGENAKDKAKTIAEDVEDYVVTSDRKKVYFINDESLYRVNGKKGGKTKTLANDEIENGLVISEKDVVYYSDADGVLYATTGGKGKKIMDDCYDIEVVNGQIFVETEDNEICFVNKTKKPKKIVTEYEEKAAIPGIPDYDMPDVG